MSLNEASIASTYFATATGPLLSQAEERALFKAVFAREDDLCIADLVRRIIAAFQPSQRPLGFYISTEVGSGEEKEGKGKGEARPPPLLRVYVNWLHKLMAHIDGQLRRRTLLEVPRDDIQQVSGFLSHETRMFISKRQAENIVAVDDSGDGGEDDDGEDKDDDGDGEDEDEDDDDGGNISFAHYSLVLDVSADLLRTARLGHKTGQLKLKFSGGQTVRAHYALCPVVHINAAMVRFMAREQFPGKEDSVRL